MRWRCGKAVICQAWFWHQGASGCRMCSKSHLRVDQLLEQEIPEDCLLLRLSQWFGSPCGCPERALTPGKRRWEHSVLYAGICGVSPSWKASDVESHRAGGDHTCARGLRSSPRSGKAAFPFHLENGKEGSSPGFSLSFWLSPCKGRAWVTPAEAPGPVPAPASSTHFVLRVPAVVFVKHFEIL